MAKHSSNLSKEEVGKFFYHLCLSIAGTKNIREAALLLRDLLSYQEAEMIAKRLKIAESLINGLTYQEIREKLRVSPGTIARVQEWLKLSGEGYRQAVERIKGKDLIKTEFLIKDYQSDWGALKKRYPMYFWPEILLESIVGGATERQKQRIKGVLKEMEKMKKKSELYKRLSKIVNFNS